jgi:hypothetical protein
MTDFKIPEFCAKDPRHIATRIFLKANLTEDEYNKRMKKYIEECKICVNDAECLAQARTNLSRDKTTYPWPNYDWDYSNYVDNNYSAQATGSNADAGVFKNLGAGIKVAKGFLTEPNPGENSKPNLWNNDGDFPIYGCQGSRLDGCKKWWNVRNRANLGKPYDDPFFNQYSTDGVNSSSYYLKVGVCDRKDITNETDCVKRGYNWVNGRCHQDRYAYMDNTGGIKPFRGLVPSMTTDLLAFNPLYIMNSFIGSDSPYMKIQDCPNIENFIDNENNNNNNIWIGILMGFLIIYISNKMKK